MLLARIVHGKSALQLAYLHVLNSCSMLYRNKLVSLVLHFFNLLFPFLRSSILDPCSFDEVLESDDADDGEIGNHIKDNYSD